MYYTSLIVLWACCTAQGHRPQQPKPLVASTLTRCASRPGRGWLHHNVFVCFVCIARACGGGSVWGSRSLPVGAPRGQTQHETRQCNATVVSVANFRQLRTTAAGQFEQRKKQTQSFYNNARHDSGGVGRKAQTCQVRAHERNGKIVAVTVTTMAAVVEPKTAVVQTTAVTLVLVVMPPEQQLDIPSA